MNLLQLRITRIVKETEDTKSFFLSSTAGKIISYKAGQFITLIIEQNDKEIRRSYSLGSCPEVDSELFITVKRKINGAISRYLYDHCKQGDLLTALPPAGKFVIENDTASTHYFIAAGSGIVPVYSLIKKIVYKHRQGNAILVYQCRSEAEEIYKNGLAMLEAQFPAKLKIFRFYSHPLEHEIRPAHINNFKLENLILHEREKNLPAAGYYLCGPPSYMRMAEFTLRLMGVDRENIHKEQFVIDTPPPPPLISDRSPKNITIRVGEDMFQLQAAYPQTILDAALHTGLRLPYSCKGGRCSTCAAICVSGQVIMSMNEVLMQEDLEKGLVLTCVGYAATDIELVLPQNNA